MNDTTNTCSQLMTVRQVCETGLISESALRRLLKEDRLKGVTYIGRKALLNYDSIVEQLKRGVGALAPPPQDLMKAAISR